MDKKSTSNGIDEGAITIDFASGVLEKARIKERRGDKREAMHAYAHAWRAAASNNNSTLADLARTELFSMALIINDTVFSSAVYRDLISVFSKTNEHMEACAHHDLGKIFRNAWQHGELLNPRDSLKHLNAARDEFIRLWEAKDSALSEMDIAHIYMHTDKIEQALVLLESAQATWRSLEVPAGSAECGLSIGDCLVMLGRNDEAIDVYKQAALDFEKAGDLTQASVVKERVESDLVNPS